MVPVFNIGLCRTGTTSFTKATNMLGYRIHFNNAGLIRQIARGSFNFGFWNLVEHDSFSDEPFSSFFQTFYLLYPYAKFVMTTRELSTWKESMRLMFVEKLKFWDEDIKEYQRKIWNVDDKAWLGKIDESFLEEWYNRHHTNVLSTIPKEKLLILPLEADNKWERLCGFLGEEIPSEDYPYLNKGER